MYLRIGSLLIATVFLLMLGGAGPVVAAPATVPVAAGYTIRDLGLLPGGSFSWVRAINQEGQVAGYGDIAGGTWHAFMWDASSGMHDLGTPPDGYASIATGINDLGQVVGAGYVGPCCLTHAFLWQQSTGMRDLGTLPGGSASEARAINDRGEVVGWSNIAGGAHHVFLWTDGQGMRDLGTSPGGLSSEPTAINNQGQVVGFSFLPGSPGSPEQVEHAFLWQASTGMQDLGTLPGAANSQAESISDDGHVVGTSGRTAFIWQASTGMQALSGIPAGFETEPAGINNRGQVVGGACSSVQCQQQFPFIWQPDRGFAALPVPPGAGLTGVAAINDKGQIAGVSQSGGPASEFHALLWQPVTTGSPPRTTATLIPPPNAAGWERTNATVTLTATAASGGAPVQSLTYNATGAPPIASTTVQGSTAMIPITAEGTTTLSYFATDQAGTQEQPQTLAVRIDTTPPTVSCQASPSTLWPPNGKFVPVQVSVSVADPNGSGPNGYRLVSITSNEGDVATEQQGFVVGTASTSGSLQAARDDNGPGRVYTLTYQGSDAAGNTATCTTTIRVPHDHGH